MSQETPPRFDFPPAFGYAHLSILLGRAVPTLQTDRCRRPWALPPACTPPGGKSPIWLLSDVLEWLNSHKDQAQTTPAAPPPPPRRRGRPTKREQLERQQAAKAAQQAQGKGGAQ